MHLKIKTVTKLVWIFFRLSFKNWLQIGNTCFSASFILKLQNWIRVFFGLDWFCVQQLQDPAPEPQQQLQEPVPGPQQQLQEPAHEPKQ